MKKNCYLISLLFILGLIIVSLVACESHSQDPKPEPEPNFSDGLEQLVASADSNGRVSATVDYSIDKAIVSSFVGREEWEYKYIQASFKLFTKEGRPFKALGLISIPSRYEGIRVGDTDFKAAGELSFTGQLETLNGLTLLRSSGSLNVSEAIGETAVSLVMFSQNDQLKDSTLETLTGTYTVDFNIGMPPTLKQSSFISEDGLAGLSFVGKNEDSSSFIGFGIIDAQAMTKELAGTANLSLFAENLGTPFGNTHKLTGLLKDPSGVLFFDEADAIAVVIGLKASRPETKVVLSCQDCKEDLSRSMTLSNYKGLSVWPNVFLSQPAYPGWTLDAALAPLPKEPTCQDIAPFLSGAIYTANAYKSYALDLQQGASLILIAKTASEFKAGSKEHAQALTKYQKYEALSWVTARTFAEQMTLLKCFK